MSTFLVDTNVLLKVFKGDLMVAQYVKSLDAAIDVTVYIECLQGSKSKLEKQKIKKALDNFPLLLFTFEVSERAIELIDTYSNSFGLFLPDALIAASALENDLTIVTYNINDFKFIQGLKYFKPTF